MEKLIRKLSKDKKGDFDGFMTVVGILFLIVFFGSILFLVLSLFALNNVEGKTGEHTGIVTAVQYQKNILWNEELAFFKTSKETTQEHEYCIANEDVKEKLKQAARDKARVTIHYDNPFFTWKWDCNGGVSIIKSVELRK